MSEDRLANPTADQTANPAGASDDLYDVVIIGGGPSGLTAAIYLARAMYRVVVVEADRFGGQITITSEVVNYPGIPSISGSELAESMRSQALSFGAELIMAKATSVDLEGDIKTVHTTRGSLRCLAVVIATGASPRKVGFEGEEEFQGRGVAFCATCDGEFFTGREVFVIGGGFQAAEEAVFLTRYASHVNIVIRKDDFSCAPSAAEAARSNEKITVLTNTNVVGAYGDDALRSITLLNNKTGEKTEWKPEDGGTFGIFVLAGRVPATDMFKDLVELDKSGYVLTDAHGMTNIPGVFASGDVCVKPLRQVATAVGDGALVATEAEKYAHDARERTGLTPKRPQPAAKDDAASTDSTQASSAESASTSASTAGASALFDEGMLAQLNSVFARMASNIELHLVLDDSSLSAELEGYMGELASLTDKITLSYADADEIASTPAAELPMVQLKRADGTQTGLAFHGVPGGHEFTSFVLGIYNAAGPGQPISDEDAAAIAAIDEDIDIKILVTLTCTMCPDTVVAAQRIAADSSHVTANVYDASRFTDLRDKYGAMSVPCVVIGRADGSEKVTFGRKGLAAMLAEL